MKISIGMNLQDGPFGGGNQFGLALTRQLRDFGHQVIFDLQDRDIDLILLTDPRVELKSCAYAHEEILDYLNDINSDCIVIHRINECDERKDSKGLNSLLRYSNGIADHTIFVSSWLRDLHLSQGMEAYPNTVILNGPDQNIFNPNGYRNWSGSGPIKLITHHWGSNWKKGFDIYQRIDELVGKRWKGLFEFTYIGNLPEGFFLSNSSYQRPLSGKPLADAIKRNHVYITGSINEPGGSHQSEGLLCGLPVLYRDSGCLQEYCDDYGIKFTYETFEERLESILGTYDLFANAAKKFSLNSEVMAKNYINLFDFLLKGKKEILENRRELPKFESGKTQKSIVSKIVQKAWRTFI